jgi:hypothetical protein
MLPCVCLRESVQIIGEDLHYLELLDSSGSSQPFESFHWDLAASSHKLNELCSLAVVEFLQDLPEPLDYLALRCVVLILRVLFKILN